MEDIKNFNKITKETLELQWFQIALKTYFWAGVLFAMVFAVSLGCLAATKYYHDQAILQHNAMERDYRSYYTELQKGRENVREVQKIWYIVDKIKQELEAKDDTTETDK